MSDPKFYAVLEKRFKDIKGPLDIRSFAVVEALLYLFSESGHDNDELDPRKAFNLLAGYNVINAVGSIGELGHKIQAARRHIWYLGMESSWKKLLEGYRNPIYDGLGVFVIEGADKLSFKRTESKFLSFEARLEDWQKLWLDTPEPARKLKIAENDLFMFYYPSEKAGLKGKFGKISLGPAYEINDFFPPSKGQRPDIEIPLRDLFRTAEKLDRKALELNALDGGKRPSHHFATMRDITLKHLKAGETFPCSVKNDSLSIRNVTNIIGMVGAGKSTLIRLVAAWCAEKHLRVCIVVPNTIETMQLYARLYEVGVDASPFVGKNRGAPQIRQKHVERLMGAEKSFLSETYSKYLTPVCLIEGSDRYNDGEDVLWSGTEPCFDLYLHKDSKTARKSGKDTKKKFMCPYFADCPGSAMYRDCLTSSVVVANPWSFSKTKAGASRTLFLMHALESFDLVIFDEADKIQANFDDDMVPFYKFYECCVKGAKATIDYYQNKDIPQMMSYSPAFKNMFSLLCGSWQVFRALYDTLNDTEWDAVTEGQMFWSLGLLVKILRDFEDSAKTTTDGKKSKFIIPKKMGKEISRAIDCHNTDDDLPLFDIIRERTIGLDEKRYRKKYNIWLEKYKGDIAALLPECGLDSARYYRFLDDCLKVIFTLIAFDSHVYELGRAYAASSGIWLDDSGLLSFLAGNFRLQLQILPFALCGNIFGMKRIGNDEKKDIDYSIARFYAFGRSLMKDLPWLRTDENGFPAGPHVMLLSGTSWVPGSLRYHVNRPVDYILEPGPGKLEFMNGAQLFLPFGNTRISGAKNESKKRSMVQLLSESLDLIIANCRGERKCLIVVNSYEQAEFAYQNLMRLMGPAAHEFGMVRIVNEDARPDNYFDGNQLFRGDLANFAFMRQPILISPTSVIERGHNIVDKTGHSAISSIFFLIRPFESPGDMQAINGRMNGHVETILPLPSDIPLWKRNWKIRIHGKRAWSWQNTMDGRSFRAMSHDARINVVATVFNIIQQVFGRMARVSDSKRPNPRIYFLDAAFGTGKIYQDKNGNQRRDFIAEMKEWLDRRFADPSERVLAETLYGSLYNAFRKALDGTEIYNSCGMAT